jgi:hypothetical protein
MPFVYSEEDMEWPEDADDDYEPPPPLPEQFEYLAPPDFGGAPEPVKFSDSPSAKAASTGPKPPLKARMFIWVLGKVLPGAGDFMAQRKQQEQDAARRRQQLFGIMVPALRQLGGRRVHCVYDGGNDEGFAWFGSLETADGSLKLEEVCGQLAGTGLKDELLQAEWLHERPDHPRAEAEVLRDVIEHSLPEEWSVLLLGWGFGTGAFSMYGAFTVDLENCTITDDRDASVPENGNILIGGRDQ